MYAADGDIAVRRGVTVVLPGAWHPGAMRVLLVEDEVELAEAVARVLRREGMAVDVAFDGREALDRASVNAYDVVVLDRDLPQVHGDEVCKALVADSTESRVLMLTAAGAIEDRVEASASARRTTCPSRSPWPSSSPAFGCWVGGAGRCRRR